MKKLLLSLINVMLVMSFAYSQRTITGTITDDAGEPLIGANLLVKGTTIGTVTDFDGSFSIDVPEDRDVLVVSYTGFETQEVSIGEGNTLDIILSEGVELDEIVVTGLGIKREKKALGYGVATINSGDIQRKVRSGCSTYPAWKGNWC